MCDKCHELKPTKTAIINGKFGNYCIDCRSNLSRPASAGAASFARDRDRETHRKDMVQPWVRGKPNTEFIRAYPDKAKDYFNQKELEAYG